MRNLAIASHGSANGMSVDRARVRQSARLFPISLMFPVPRGLKDIVRRFASHRSLFAMHIASRSSRGQMRFSSRESSPRNSVVGSQRTLTIPRAGPVSRRLIGLNGPWSGCRHRLCRTPSEILPRPRPRRGTFPYRVAVHYCRNPIRKCQANCRIRPLVSNCSSLSRAGRLAAQLVSLQFVPLHTDVIWRILIQPPPTSAPDRSAL
jgi:hypothetical protein